MSITVTFIISYNVPFIQTLAVKYFSVSLTVTSPGIIPQLLLHSTARNAELHPRTLLSGTISLLPSLCVLCTVAHIAKVS